MYKKKTNLINLTNPTHDINGSFLVCPTTLSNHQDTSHWVGDVQQVQVWPDTSLLPLTPRLRLWCQNSGSECQSQLRPGLAVRPRSRSQLARVFRYVNTREVRPCRVLSPVTRSQQHRYNQQPDTNKNLQFSNIRANLRPTFNVSLRAWILCWFVE